MLYLSQQYSIDIKLWSIFETKVCFIYVYFRKHVYSDNRASTEVTQNSTMSNRTNIPGAENDLATPIRISFTLLCRFRRFKSTPMYDLHFIDIHEFWTSQEKKCVTMSGGQKLLGQWMVWINFIIWDFGLSSLAYFNCVRIYEYRKEALWYLVKLAACLLKNYNTSIKVGYPTFISESWRFDNSLWCI